MRQINWRHPKYVIPLIIYPFTFLLFYIAKDAFAKEPEEEQRVTQGVDFTVPKPYLEKRKIKNKMDALRSRFDKRGKHTAIRGLDIERQEKEVLDYGFSDQDMDSIMLNTEKKPTMKEKVEIALNRDRPKRGIDLFVEQNGEEYLLPEKDHPPIVRKPKPQPISEPAPQKETEVEEFKKRLAVIDSMMKTPDQRKQEELEKQLAEERRRQEEEEKAREAAIVPISKSKSTANGHFNTLSSRNEHNMISAILDEGLKVTSNSRVRIRLLEDVYAGETLIRKGQYLFGTVKGFSSQRVKIEISSLLHEGKPIPVRLNLYDNDGMEGLFVPESEFRDFTKELASQSSQGMTLSSNPENSGQFFYQIGQSAVSTTSRAFQKAVKKNKASLKYNTIVYLIDPKQQ
ncbi:conjugative transposon protein TraM [Persicobacter diffluens]|uniref:Conjugative transposon protein TraM n=1 Tax=Persicobacter diffluens TaxID=981 RepID=A0AAN4W5S4_9BACT|nr:conjugative transposon protein TraM [Persicobacter diffluens]